MKKYIWLTFLALVILAALWIRWGNTALVVTEYTVRDGALPVGFRGMRIVQVSDTHDAEIGPDNEQLIAAVRAAEPDVIFITGDLIDSNRLDLSRAISLASRLACIASTYYVTGNHEAAMTYTDREALHGALRDAGVTVLQDARVTLSRGGDEITLVGMDDIGMIAGTLRERKDQMESRLTELISGYSIVLSHRPDLFPEYVRSGANLVFSGHAHGGQVRLPFVGGILSPGQGFFPEYDAGLFTEGGTTMVVSRGIGNSLFPFRVNNRPEIVVVTLQGE